MPTTNATTTGVARDVTQDVTRRGPGGVPRVSPDAVANLLTRHDGVARAAVRARPPGAHGPGLVAHVVPAAARDEREAAHVEEWQQIYERVYTQGAGEPFGENFTGWDSSYDGRPIPLAQMREWREATVRRVRELAPRRVLEIGVGSGLLLSHLAPDCEEYWGTDLSPAAIDDLARHVADQPYAARVTLRTQPADRLAGLPEHHFDTVVLNSVTQCFPGGDYLTRVVHGALRLLAPGGALFVGDVRDLRTVGWFHTAVGLHRRPGTDAAALAAAADKDRGRDEELLLHPDYFAAAPARHPEVAAVDIQLKRGRWHTEMSRHRYDVVLHTAPARVTRVDDAPRLAWGSQVGDTASLAARLAGLRGPLRVTGVPNARTAGEAAAWHALAAGDAARARRELTGPHPDAVDPETLARVAEDAGLHLALAPAPDRPDHLEAVFLPRPPGRVALAGTYQRAAAARPAPGDPPLALVPAAARRAERFAARLRAWLGDRLPDGVPLPEIVVRDALPPAREPGQRPGTDAPTTPTPDPPTPDPHTPTSTPDTKGR